MTVAPWWVALPFILAIAIALVGIATFAALGIRWALRRIAPHQARPFAFAIGTALLIGSFVLLATDEEMLLRPTSQLPQLPGVWTMAIGVATLLAAALTRAEPREK